MPPETDRLRCREPWKSGDFERNSSAKTRTPDESRLLHGFRALPGAAGLWGDSRSWPAAAPLPGDLRFSSRDFISAVLKNDQCDLYLQIKWKIK